MSENAPILALDAITYAYPGRDPVLDTLDFALRPGDKIGLVGPNGSGKTTLFLVAMGLVKPDSGRILHHGRELKDEKGFRGLRAEVGLLFQNADDQLFSPTVLEDVCFGPLNLGKSPEEAKDAARRTLAELGLGEYEDRVTYKLSGGEKKLVSLATVLAMRPKALFLDEPTNDLDPDTRLRLERILADLDLARVIISHDWEFLSRTTDRFITMDQGRITDGELVPHEHKHAHHLGDQPHGHL